MQANEKMKWVFYKPQRGLRGTVLLSLSKNYFKKKKIKPYLIAAERGNNSDTDIMAQHAMQFQSATL